MRGPLLCALLGPLVAGCAREATPPGGPPDRLPPIVILSDPDTFSTVEPFRSPVTLRFSERISERPSAGTLDQAVVVSPTSGDVRVSHGREGLSVRVAGGFEAGRVYRLTVLPVIQDMFGNSLQEPFELFFSTGPPFAPNVVAGSVVDRLTGEPLRDARVDAAVAGSDVVHTAVTDSAGIFALRYLPAGEYVVSAYLDRNRNAEPDFTEPQGTRPAPLGAGGQAADTMIVLDVALLPRDTTFARIARVAVEDSISLNVSLDDFLDPELPLDDVRVVVTSDSVEGREPLAVLHPHEVDAYRSALADSLAREQAVLDSLARAQADSAARAEAAAGDTAAVEPEPTAAEAEPELAPAPAGEEAVQAGDPPERERPPAQQSFVVILDGVLVPEVPYEVEISNITNINGVGGGGGTVEFTRPAPPPPPEDTTETDADSIARDTIPAEMGDEPPPVVDSVGRDTIPADPTARDTLAAPPPPPEDTTTTDADSIARDTIPAEMADEPPAVVDSVGRDTVPADPTARDTLAAPPPSPEDTTEAVPDSIARDTVPAGMADEPPPPADSVRRDTASAPPRGLARRDAVAIRPAGRPLPLDGDVGMSRARHGDRHRPTRRPTP